VHLFLPNALLMAALTAAMPLPHRHSAKKVSMRSLALLVGHGRGLEVTVAAEQRVRSRGGNMEKMLQDQTGSLADRSAGCVKV